METFRLLNVSQPDNQQSQGFRQAGPQRSRIRDSALYMKDKRFASNIRGKVLKMSKDNPIRLAELIKNVKHELLSTETDSDKAIPLFSVDQIVLDLQITIKKEAKGGLQIYVVELGGGASRDDVQTVKVTLTPLLSKEERIRLYRTRYPERWQALETASIEAGLKGTEESLEDKYGG